MVWIYTTKVYFQSLLLKTLGVLSTTCSYVCWSEKLHTFKGIQQYSNSQRSIDTNKVLYYTLLFEGRQKILKIQNLLYEKQYIFFERISLLVCDCVCMWLGFVDYMKILKTAIKSLQKYWRKDTTHNHNFHGA